MEWVNGSRVMMGQWVMGQGSMGHGSMGQCVLGHVYDGSDGAWRYQNCSSGVLVRVQDLPWGPSNNYRVSQFMPLNT